MYTYYNFCEIYMVLIYKPYCCTVHFVESLQLLTNNYTYKNSIQNHLKTLKITPKCFDLF